MSNYTLVTNGDFSTVTALIDGDLYTANNSHKNFSQIVSALVAGNATPEMFDVATAITSRFEVLTERVALKGNNIYFDGDVITGAIVDQILKFVEDDEDFTP